MKSETLERLKREKEGALRDLYDSCTPKEQDLFNRMYFYKKPVSFIDFPEDKIDWAIQQCDNTIRNRNEKQNS